MRRDWKQGLLSGLLAAGIAMTGSWVSAGVAYGNEVPENDTTAQNAQGFVNVDENLGAPNPPGSLFVDVPDNHWAISSIRLLVDEGVVAGDPAGNFRPEEPITRAELYKMVLGARRLDAGTRAHCQGFFRDVSCDAWYAMVAETAYRMALADGTGDDHFHPNRHVTREELLTVVNRAQGKRWTASRQSWADIHDTLDIFTDRWDIATWARPAIALAVKEGQVAGFSDGSFGPAKIASRAEAAAMVSRIVLPTTGLESVEIDGRQVYFSQAVDMRASMYAVGESGVGHTTYTGVRVRVGAVAVDPNVIPLGTLLYVEDYGYAVAVDIGGAIKGNRIDLFTWDYHEAAYRFGIQSRRVWVLH